MDQPEPLAPINDLGVGDPLRSWHWLVGEGLQPSLLSAMGDMFLQEHDNRRDAVRVLLLDTYAGRVMEVATSWDAFRERMANQDAETAAWFKYDFLCELYERGLFLSLGQCFAPTIPPIIGGKYEVDNFTPVPWRAHVEVMGQIHRQVKGLPPGTPIKGIDLKWRKDSSDRGEESQRD